jgi:hypothetical protein
MKGLQSTPRGWLIAAVLSLAALGATSPEVAAAPSAGAYFPATVAATPLANWTYYRTQAENLLFNSFRSRERMVQLVLVGVCIGLFIMLKRMPGKV